MKIGEPKGTGFLLPTEVQNNPPSTNQVKLTVRSDEARQSSQVGGDFYMREYCKQWRKKHPDYHKNYAKIYHQNGWTKTFRNVTSRCKWKRGHYFKKGIKSFLKTKDCKFLWFRDKAYLMKEPSIDRINSNKNYTLENCRYKELKENIKVGQLKGSFKKGFDARRNIRGINQYTKTAGTALAICHP